MPDFLWDKDLLVGQAHGARHERANPTESYVCVPPAFALHDSDGGMWTLGFNRMVEHHKEYEFPVLRNDVDTGESAKRIEYRRGRVWIFGYYGWKHFSRSRRHFI